MYYLADVLPKRRLSLQSGSIVGASIALLICTMNIVHAQSMPPTLRNFGNDPFVRISQEIADCPEPAGPRISEAQWKREAHHRIEQGNHCYVEGRCRLANAYQYDNDIAEALQRRLDTLRRTQPAWQNSSLWITVSGRRLTVQGCVAPDFHRSSFLGALREIADVEQVIDQTTSTPARGVPYTLYDDLVTNSSNR
jgi:hypothetical protein